MVAKQSAAAARPMTDDKCAASGITTDATRLAAVCDKIDEYSVGGATMSGKQTASICAMIDDLAMSGKGRRKRRRSVDSTHCYKQICHIGKGGFGVVSKARHCKTARTVAMKTFRALGDGEDEPSDVSELLREACFLAACGGHPYLVGFHGVARNPVSDEYSLVMEYVGPNLRDTLTAHLERQQGRAFPEADVRGVMRQLLTGAEAMHGLCVIHRDIKPENVLVSDDGSVVKICDFGLAMSTAESSRPPYDERVGTARYMAPEVLTRMPGYDERVDVWSLGCVMAELLSGEALFEFNADDDEDDVFVHLGGIFDVLGAPAAESFQMFMPPLMVGKVLRRLAALPPPCYRRRLRGRLRELFPGEMLSQDGFDVLKGLLACNPKERLTAAAALRLPWFTDTVDAPALVHRSPFVRVLNCVWALFRQIVLPLM